MSDRRDRARQEILHGDTSSGGGGGSSPFSAGVFLFVGSLLVGTLAALTFPAAQEDAGFSGKNTAWTIVTDTDGTFNWGIFLAFTAVGIICFAIGVVGEAIVDTIRETRPAPATSAAQPSQ